jgi:guanine deaminase
MHRVEYAVTPRFAITCSEELMAQAGIIAKLFGSIVQTHLAENESECRIVRDLFSNETYTEVYEKAGLLGERTLLGHGIFLAPSERKILRETRSVVCHCPTANTFLQSGIMPRALWKHEGLRVSLGSDIGAGTDRSMVRAAQAMVEIAKYYRMILRDGANSAHPLHHLANEHVTIPNAAEAWWQITTGNAQAIGWDDVGELKAANSADLLLIQPDIAFRNAYDPLATLFYNWDERWIKNVLVAGKDVYTPR